MARTAWVGGPSFTGSTAPFLGQNPNLVVSYTIPSFSYNMHVSQTQLERGTTKVGDEEGEAKPLCVKTGCV
jgi:hypothetical protein